MTDTEEIRVIGRRLRASLPTPARGRIPLGVMIRSYGRTLGMGAAFLIGGCSGDAPVAPAPPVPTSVVISPTTASLASIGETVRFAATVYDQYGQVMAAVVPNWATSNSSVATVNAGVATAVGNGTASITATAGTTMGSANVTVAQRVARVVVTPESLAFSSLGDTDQLSAEAFDANGNRVGDVSVSWQSDAVSVVTVDDGGEVTAVGNGTANVSAGIGGVTGQATAMVDQMAAEIEVNPSILALSFFGDTGRLSAEARDANGHSIGEITFEWRSGDPTVAVVDNRGMVTAVGSGSASIIASADDAEANAIVTVPPALSTDGGFLGHVSTVARPPNAPDWNTFGPVSVNIPTATTVGERGTITIRVRDHQCEDGDRVAIMVYNAQSRSWTEIFRGEIFNHWQTRTYAVTAGYHYIVDVHALNGTGFKGNCSYANVNTGEVFISNSLDSGSGAVWETTGGAGSRTAVNVHVR